jgi:hypothetical protein
MLARPFVLALTLTLTLTLALPLTLTLTLTLPLTRALALTLTLTLTLALTLTLTLPQSPRIAGPLHALGQVLCDEVCDRVDPKEIAVGELLHVGAAVGAGDTFEDARVSQLVE